MNDNRCPDTYHAVEKHRLVMRQVYTAVGTILLIYIAAERLTPFGIMDTAAAAEPHPPVNPYIPSWPLQALAGNT